MKIFHADMNSFFASCEQAENPELLGKPLVVCSNPKDNAGIVLAASYEAKSCGVKTAMLKREAQKLCPDAVFVASNFRLYCETSRKVMAIFDEFTPRKEPASIDEAYLDMTGTEYLFGDSLNAARLIQDAVKQRLGIGCSIGISTNKLLAKMASDMKKPLGITELYLDDVPQKLWPLKVSELFGVGRKTSEKLESLGIKRIGDLARTDYCELRRHFGEASAYYLMNSAKGIGPEDIDTESWCKNQSIGNEMTYDHNLTDMEEIRNELLFLTDTISYRLRKKHLKAKCVTVKIKYGDFSVITRSRTLHGTSDSTELFYETACKLFSDNWSGRPLRLLGVTLSAFDDDAQISLFSDETVFTSTAGKTDAVMDALREKYGYDAISRGSLLGRQHKKL